MQHRAVLDIGVLSDAEPVRIAAQCAVPPDRDILFQPDLTDDAGVGGNPALRVNDGRVVAKGIDRHDSMEGGRKKGTIKPLSALVGQGAATIQQEKLISGEAIKALAQPRPL